jgi:carboxymethylenebutenolidase
MRSMYQASPKHASPSAPGVVVVQAIWGIDAQLRDVVRRFAKAGYVAAAPDLYVDLNAPNADASSDFAPFREIAAKLVDENVDAQIATAAKHLRMGAAHRKIGVTGFCMGGGITLRQTIVNASLFQAAAMWYDKVNDPSLADSVKVPLLGSFGARDTSIPPDDVRAFEQRLKIAHDFKIYEEAGHAFFDDTRRSYIGSAAADAWHRTLAWFKAYLSQSGQRSVALGGGESSVYP